MARNQSFGDLLSPSQKLKTAQNLDLRVAKYAAEVLELYHIGDKEQASEKRTLIRRLTREAANLRAEAVAAEATMAFAEPEAEPTS